MWDMAGGDDDVDILTNGAMCRLVGLNAVQYRTRVLLNRRKYISVIAGPTMEINEFQYPPCGSYVFDLMTNRCV